jgi:glycopeptide antibiotics resistance protein
MNYSQWKSYGSDIIGNVLLFIPLSFFLVFWLSRKEFKRVILVAIATSILIETIQFIFEIGVADIDDVILNVTGAAIGFFISKAILGKPLPY